MKTSVIILNWNGRKLLEEFLPYAVKYTCGNEIELIVADNGSSDGSAEYVRFAFPSVRVIEFDENYGFAEGYNRAVKLVESDYTVLLNSDVEVTEGWWQPLVEYLDMNPRCAALQPKIKSRQNREYFEYAGAAGGYLDRLGYPWCRGRLFDSVEKDEGQYDGEPVEVCWASGACLAVRRDVYLTLGGLDTNFFAHMEEIDLCCRMHAAGWSVKSISSSEVFHVGGASLQAGNPHKTYLNFRNNLLLLHKNLPRKKGRKILFFRRLTDTLAFGMYLAKGDFANANAILKAHSDFRKMRRDYREFPKKDFLSRLPGSKRMAVWDRYIKRMKK